MKGYVLKFRHKISPKGSQYGWVVACTQVWSDFNFRTKIDGVQKGGRPRKYILISHKNSPKVGKPHGIQG